MMTHSMRIRRQLRSARASALTSEERRMELRAAEAAAAQKDDRSSPKAGAACDDSPPTHADTPERRGGPLPRPPALRPAARASTQGRRLRIPARRGLG